MALEVVILEDGEVRAKVPLPKSESQGKAVSFSTGSEGFMVVDAASGEPFRFITHYSRQTSADKAERKRLTDEYEAARIERARKRAAAQAALLAQGAETVK